MLQIYGVCMCVYFPAFAGTHCAYPRRDGQAELTWMAGYTPRWFTRPQTVTNQSSNRARRKVTSLIETNALQSQSPNKATKLCSLCHQSIITRLVFARDSIYAKRAYAIAIPSVRLSVCLSVCLSVTRVDQSKTVEVRIMQFSPHSSPIPLVFVR